MDTQIAIAEPRTAAVATKPAQTLRVTGKVRTAIEAMVWDGLPRDEAAAKAGISPHGLYKAFRKPPVKAFYLAELDVLRTSERARNIHALVNVRDASGNQAARVAAVNSLEHIAETRSTSGQSHALPGITVIISAGGNVSADTPHMHTIDHKPLIDNDGG